VVVLAAVILIAVAVVTEFRGNPAGYSDLVPAAVPI
jgi:hypothetical protein